MNPLLLTDSYKVHHPKMYPDDMTLLYSNSTPRKSRIKGIDKVVFFGLQHFCLEYLIEKFNKEFFIISKAERDQMELEGHEFLTNFNFIKEGVLKEYSRHIQVDTKHIAALWELGYLPIRIKAVKEGSLVPIGVPCFTIVNTHADFGWLTNYLETLISCMLWQATTSATIAFQYRKILNQYALETTGSTEGVQWQGHDFSMRGMSSPESAILSGMGHLLSFTGTDTIPAIYQLEESYQAEGLIGASVPATEHSVMCMGTKESEIKTFRRLLNLYPTGILSVVSDTWDLWKVCTEYLPELKQEILARDGKLVIRPDSGDPVDIICGEFEPYRVITKQEINTPHILPVGQKFIFLEESSDTDQKYYTKTKDGYVNYIKQPKHKGVIELLWETFGGTTNEYGFKVLDSHIGAIYGDSITIERAQQICERLKAKGFASTNIVLGIGSYTYQYNTRDTFGFAMKATYGELIHKSEGSWFEARKIFKDPITDDGTKKSKKGLLRVYRKEDGDLACADEVSWELEKSGELEVVFENGKLVRTQTLEEIRNILKEQL